ncbi:MAG: hypothetical protein AAB847_02995 [Patescibacteria group bacterium]
MNRLWKKFVVREGYTAGGWEEASLKMLIFIVKSTYAKNIG